MQWKADFCSLTQQLFVRSEGRSPLHLMLSFDLVGGCKPSETISTGVEKPPGCQCSDWQNTESNPEGAKVQPSIEDSSEGSSGDT